MTYRIRARADKRALSVGLALGGTVGLVLGGAYAAGGMARAADQHAAAQRVSPLATAHPAAAPAAPAAGKPLAVTRVSTAPAKPFSLPQAGARDLDCLADAVYYEARGESVAGQAAVAQVVLNRVRHPEFPKTVCGVVFQGAATGSDCQFSFACDGAMDRPKDRIAWAQAERIAARALAGVVMPQVGTATHFHAVGVEPEWGPGLMRVAQVGLHVFYRFGHGGRFDGAVRPSAPGADSPHAVYASMLPGIGIGGGDDAAAKPAVAAAASAPQAAASIAPNVSLASAAAIPSAKADSAAAKPAAPAPVS